jgi:hypothetical protein
MVHRQGEMRATGKTIEPLIQGHQLDDRALTRG